MLKVDTWSALLTASIGSFAVIGTRAYMRPINKLTPEPHSSGTHNNQMPESILINHNAHFQANQHQIHTSNQLNYPPYTSDETYLNYYDKLARRSQKAEALVGASTDSGTTTFAESLKSFDHLKTKPAQIVRVDQHNQETTTTASSMLSALISATSMPSGRDNLSAQKMMLNDSLLMVNGTDPFAITAESRNYSVPVEIQIIMCLFYITLAFTAIASNMIVCYIVLSNQRMRTATNYFIVNLAVGDILMALLCIPFTFPANLIFQSWPFGLTLCVIVSYSQANSVFISAYTMVAISIDKYIAIMYPMRPRVPKNQAKIIILVIWSAALITSLPTALLSNLTSTSLDLSPAQANTIVKQAQVSLVTHGTAQSAVGTIGPSREQENSSQLFKSAADKNQEPANTMSPFKERQQETLSTPASKNPSLTIAPSPIAPSSSSSNPNSTSSTYTPMNEHQHHDNYEEQKMLVCGENWFFWPQGKYYYSMALMILQFVLPLFVLVITYTRIVIVVWGKRMPGEEDNARDARMARSKRKMIKMVIFCVIAFALTWLPFNALIVIGDMHPVVWEHEHIMYIWFITHYLAMCHTVTNPLIYIWMNNRFRAGFKQVIGAMCNCVRGSCAYIACTCPCCGCCFNCSGRKQARLALQVGHKRIGRAPFASTGQRYKNKSANSAANNTGRPSQIGLTTTTTAITGNCSNRPNLSNCSAAHDLAARASQSVRVDMDGDQAASVEVSVERHAQEPRRTNCWPNRTAEACPETPDERHKTAAGATIATSGNPVNCDNLHETIGRHRTQHKAERGASGEQNCSSASGQQAAGMAAHHRLPKRVRLLRCFRGGQQQTSAGHAQALDQSRARNSAAAGEQNGTSGAQKRRRKKQLHAINLQVITSEMYAATATQKRAKCCGQAEAAKLAPICAKSTIEGKSATSGTDCPSCKQNNGFDQGGKRFTVDTNQSSQSTGTISAQTNNTSLALSSMNSARDSGGESDGQAEGAVAAAEMVVGSAGGGAEAGGSGGGEMENADNGNNTSGSLSTIECSSGESESANELASGANSAGSTRYECGEDEDDDEDAPRDESGPIGEGRAELVAQLEFSSTAPRPVDSFDGISPARTRGSLATRFDEPASPLRTATSLEGDQLAARGRPIVSEEGQSISSHLLRLTWRSSHGQRAAAAGKFCRQHRQTVSAAGHSQLLAISWQDDDFRATDEDVRDNYLSDSNINGLDDCKLEPQAECKRVGGSACEMDGRRVGRCRRDIERTNRMIRDKLACLLPGHGDVYDDNDSAGRDGDEEPDESQEQEDLLTEYGDSPRRAGQDAIQMLGRLKSGEGGGRHAPGCSPPPVSLNKQHELTATGLGSSAQLESGRRLGQNNASAI